MAQANDQINDEFIDKELKEKLNTNDTTITQEQHHSKSTNDSKKMSQNWTLMQLPPELILLIFSYIDARFALSILCQVCKLFNQLLSSEASWKTRFGKRWPTRDRKQDYDYIVR